MKKVDNSASRLLVLEKKVRELKKEVHLLRLSKGKMEEDVDEEDEDEEKEEKDEEDAKEDEEEKEEKGFARKETRKKATMMSTTEKIPLSLNLMLLHWFAKSMHLDIGKDIFFSNTMDTLLVLTPSPPPFPQLTTLVHVSSTPVTSQPPSPC